MDILSDVISLVRPRSYGAGALTGGGRWALDFPAFSGIKCYALVKGECWFVVDGAPGPVHLSAGDCLMLPHGRAFRMCSDLAARARDARTLVSGDAYNGIRSCAPGDDFFLVGGHFALEGNAALLSSVLPPFVHLHEERDRQTMCAAVERIQEELRAPRAGSTIIAQQSAYTMLVLALRLHLEGERGSVGWLFALADEQLAAAIGEMHEKPAHRWTVEMLARTAGMSRTTFAEHFRRTVGASPMDYLTRWRMQVAADRLLRSKDPISVIAESVGYESESAFSAAFKRTMGASPREYCGRRRKHGAQGSC